MLENRRGAASVSLGGRLYVFGGEGGIDGEYVLSASECFDPIRGQWEALTPMSQHRFCAGVVAFRGSAYLCGGSVGMDALCSAEVFQAKTIVTEFESTGRSSGSPWKKLPAMLDGRVGAACAVSNNCLYACGSSHAESIKNDVELLRLDGC